MKKILFFCFILLSVSSFAQINFEPGYFINNQGIKTECLIRNYGWKSNPIQIEYKLTENESSKIATIKEIDEFNVGNNYKYKRFTVNIDRSSSDVRNLNESREPIWLKETLFLNVLVEGNATLYQYEDGNLTRYFITHDDDITEQLVHKEYMEGQSHVNENNQFRQQLYIIMKSEKLTTKDFENLQYQKQSLIKLFTNYNESKNTKSTNFEVGKNKTTLNIKVTAGINITSFSISNPVGNTSMDFDAKTSFQAGLEAECILPTNQKKWSIFANPNFQYYKSEGEKNHTTGSIDYKSIELPVGFRHYMFVSKESKIYLEAGYAVSITFNSKLKYSGSDLEISKTADFFAGTGFSYKKYSIGARYVFPQNLLNSYNYYLDSKYKSFSILLGYKFL